MRVIIHGLLVIVSAIAFAACRPPAPEAKAKKAPAPVAPLDQAALDARFAKSDIQVTLDEFNKIKPGMTYDQVLEIIGAPETDKKTRYNPGNPDAFTHPSVTMIYRWENPDSSWCELEFVEKKLDTKRHQDLKPASAYDGSQFTLPEIRHALKAPAAR